MQNVDRGKFGGGSVTVETRLPRPGAAGMDLISG